MCVAYIPCYGLMVSERDHLRKGTTMGNSRNTLTLSIIAVVFTLAISAGSAVAGNNPVDEKWWPSEFGADDQAGAVKYITPEKRIAAAQLVKKGRTATLGMPYYNGMPLVPGRTFALSITLRPSWMRC